MLRLPDELIESIPPRPPGFQLTREAFPRDTGVTFDPLGAAASAVVLTLDVLLEPTRAARMIAAYARDAAMPGFGELTEALLSATWFSTPLPGMDGEIQRLTSKLVLEHLLFLEADRDADTQVRAIAFDSVSELDRWLETRIAEEDGRQWRAHYRFARHLIEQVRRDPAVLATIVPLVPPPGSPVGGFSTPGR